MFEGIIRKRNESIHSQPVEVVFCKIERPATLKHKIIYILESICDVIYGVDTHVYRKLVDSQLCENFDSVNHSTIISITIWECTACHYKQMMIMKEEKYYE
jgi:hypothetical protein